MKKPELIGKLKPGGAEIHSGIPKEWAVFNSGGRIAEDELIKKGQKGEKPN